jgi:large subunit ribosomal protein L22
MAWTATYRFARISPKKVCPVMDLIRGKGVDKALSILKFTPNRAASLVRKTLASAIANADEAEADVEMLVVRQAYVGKGVTMKRIQPKDRGRAHPIHKRTSHITVVVEEARKTSPAAAE